MGTTLLWLSLIVLIPLAGLVFKAVGSWADLWETVSSPRALSAYRVSFFAAATAAVINGLFGPVVAWVLVRYRFPGKSLADALVDFPFALPTAVAGLTFSDLYAPNGWLGRFLVPLGIEAVFTPLAVVVVLTFVTLPFVIRSVQPVLESFEAEAEDAAESLGASRWQTLRYVILPALLPAWLSGLALAVARAIGEYGSVIFVSGNMPFRTEIAPLLIVIQLEQYNYAGATGIAIVLLVTSFAILGAINLIERWSRRDA
jgi:sulfate transport system permease protein